MIGEQLHILLTCSAEAVEKIVDVGCRELGRVFEASHVVIDIVVLLDGLNNVALALKLEELLGNHSVGVIAGHEEVTEVAIVPVEVGRVTVGTLVVGDGPLGSGHDAQVVVSVSVERRSERILREVTLLNYHQSQSVSISCYGSTNLRADAYLRRGVFWLGVPV